jgi:hypothetical protein
MKIVLTLTLPILLSGCLLETVGPIDRNLKPYGAHWVREGMTEEQRLDDIEGCGGGKGLYVGFPDVQVKAEKRVEESTDFPARNRLFKAWSKCMEAKGYHYQGQ